jgi:hypothetical protein
MNKKRVGMLATAHEEEENQELRPSQGHDINQVFTFRFLACLHTQCNKFHPIIRLN